MEHTIAIIGLGYVGLPLAVQFGKKYTTIGFDINTVRIDELREHRDRTREMSPEELKCAAHLSYTCNVDDLRDCNTYIITVPTPIDRYNRPDLTLLKKASSTVGSVIARGDIVIYESTVYPGATEEDCVPVIEQVSGLTYNRDFFCGYSPERINPGDKAHRLVNIKKVTSGSTPEAALIVDNLYKSIIEAGTHLAPCIKVAEAAKVIENAQRDINIAFINELAMIFSRMNIRTRDVLDAARTKWNFLAFEPGLVGGHCIGVDPYYLTHKAESLGYIPQIILAGRRLNDGMGRYVATQLIKMMVKKAHRITDTNILVLGITFKENCPDIRNSKVIDIIKQLQDFDCNFDVYDPLADPDEVKAEYGIDLITSRSDLKPQYEGIMVAVAHDEFKSLDLKELKAQQGVIFDVKNFTENADEYL
ncbi:MAG TPA: nucleotide sugar dehydrogenase [Deltaproteobacteria bacterium]|nr:nucleotide sugar dehydrogenase [Deltaproteobacteria bacterium]HPJ94364.1 nucleotide sugar dehydrogenase [Deltaproteobacteria bacterium]HPR50516.1 nucleotide sugar dehydrogenase [Deltaproteobacteria bacterium]